MEDDPWETETEGLEWKDDSDVMKNTRKCIPASPFLLEGTPDVLERTLVSLGELEPIFVYIYSLKRTFKPLDLEIGMRKSTVPIRRNQIGG